MPPEVHEKRQHERFTIESSLPLSQGILIDIHSKKETSLKIIDVSLSGFGVLVSNKVIPYHPYQFSISHFNVQLFCIAKWCHENEDNGRYRAGLLGNYRSIFSLFREYDIFLEQ